MIEYSSHAKYLYYSGLSDRAGMRLITYFTVNHTGGFILLFTVAGFSANRQEDQRLDKVIIVIVGYSWCSGILQIWQNASAMMWFSRHGSSWHDGILLVWERRTLLGFSWHYGILLARELRSWWDLLAIRVPDTYRLETGDLPRLYDRVLLQKLPTAKLCKILMRMIE